MVPAVDFSNSYLWRWMSQQPRNNVHEQLRGWLSTSGAGKAEIIHGLSPDFLAWFGPVTHDTYREEVWKISRYVPPWLWHQMFYCGQRYYDFFVRIWPSLARVATDLVYLDWMLYVEPVNMKYREHLVHMFKVACVGTWFLDDLDFLSEITQSQFNSQRFHNWLKANFPRWYPTQDDQNLIVQWGLLLAALMHDFGYGYHLRGLVDDRVGSLYDWTASTVNNTELTAAAQQSVENSLAMEYIRGRLACCHQSTAPDGKAARRRRSGFVRDVLPLNHSMASCLFILAIRDRLNEARALTDPLRLAFEIAAEAAMIHDMCRAERWVGMTPHHSATEPITNPAFLHSNSYQETPVAVLLIMADELAIWQRPQLKEPPRNESSRQVTYRFDNARQVTGLHIDLLPNRLEIRLRASSEYRDDHASNLDHTLRSHPAFRGEFFGRTIDQVT